MIKVIVDSTCDLPENLLSKYDIRTVPLLVSVGEREYRDKVDIQPPFVYNAMKNGAIPKTAQIDLDFLTAVFRECCENNQDFIYIAFSSALSCTCHSAGLILEDFKEKYPAVNMAVVDSKGGSMAEGLIAIQAACLIEQGRSFHEIVDCISEMRDHTEHIFTISDLKWLVKGGRIDPISGTIGSILGVKPIVHVKNGCIAMLKKVRGKENAVAAIGDIVAERIKEFPEQLIAIAHSGSLAAAEALQKRLALKLGSKSFLIGEIGSVLSAHLGIGGLGVFFFNKKLSFYSDIS